MIKASLEEQEVNEALSFAKTNERSLLLGQFNS